MIKNLVLATAALSMVAAPVSAEAKDRHNHQRKEWNDRSERHGGGGCGWLCGAIIGGLVVGALSSDREERRDPDYDKERDYDNRYYPPDYRYDRRYCVREQITEWRRGERYVYWQTTCN